MKGLLIPTLLVVALLGGACSGRGSNKITGADAAPDAVPTLSASYVVNGFDPRGVEYGGTLQVLPGDAPGSYALQWIITGSIQEGVGRMQGNRLLVTWETIDGIGSGITGVTTYTITTKGEMYGPRTVEGFDKPGSENAFPNPPD